MTRLFRNIRIAGFVSIAAFSAVVLGISAYLATKLLPNIRHDFTIFALVPPSWTILMCIVLLLVSTPRVEVTATFMTGVLWLIMGAWLADDLGSRTCTSLAGQTTQLQDGTISSEQYCDMQKVQEAFAWLLFILMLLWFFIVITLAHRSVAMGREYIWSENTNFLPWFGQVPSWPGLEEGQWPAQFRPFYGYPGFSQMQTVQSQPMYVQSQPGFVGSQPGYVQTHPSYVSHAPTGVPMSAY